MIQLTCTKCRTVLTMDEAFAGGVCRCQHCGTIQTVPTQKKQASAAGTRVPVTPVGKPSAPVEVFSPGGATAPAKGLEELAQVVASSGLGTGLSASRLHHQPPAPRASNRKAIMAGGIAGVLIAVIILAVVFMRGSGESGDGSPSPVTANGVDPALATSGPHFMGIPLRGSTVVYVLDRGSGTADVFHGMTGGTIKSIESLGAQRRFQVVFWDVDGTPVVAPPSAMAATGDNIKLAQDGMRDVTAYAASQIEPALTRALEANPDEVIIASGKYGLDDAFVASVLSIRGSRTFKVHTVALGQSASPEALTALAVRTGGQFRAVPGDVVRQLAEFAPN